MLFRSMETLKYLVNNQDQPQRTFYVAFGHDEEVGGYHGAQFIAKQLKTILDENDETLDFVLDEGLFLMEEKFPGVENEVALIGVVEKGYVNVNITTTGPQGHSSTPPKESSISILADAITQITNERQPSRFGDSVEIDTFRYIAPYTSFGYKLI